MVAVGTFPPVVEAATLIGVVLLEAIVLYLGYGLAEQLVGGPVIERIKRA